MSTKLTVNPVLTRTIIAKPLPNEGLMIGEFELEFLFVELLRLDEPIA
jgi:hypothetical protein